MRRLASCIALLAGYPVAHAAADEPAAPQVTAVTPAYGEAAGPAPGGKAPPPPYSLPWQLRPLTVGNVLRSDTSVAFYDAGGEPGTTVGDPGYLRSVLMDGAARAAAVADKTVAEAKEIVGFVV